MVGNLCGYLMDFIATALMISRLSPHESPKTDVVLLGHSMGGILSAEVVLLKQLNSESFQHRILGTINFDTPFLGMHPGVVVSGLGSLFRPAPELPNARPQQESSSGQEVRRMPTNDEFSASPSATFSLHQLRTQSSTTSGYFSPPASSATSSRQDSGTTNLQQILSPDLPTKDPNYNPPFPNDIRVPTRTGWDNALHFVMKHSDGLTKATKSYVTSHLEFGGAMADYKGLQTRYAKLRALEDVDEKRSGHRRIRFINYYTASTGRLKRPKSPSPRRSRSQIGSQLDGSGKPMNQSLQELSLSAPDTRSPSRSPRISVGEHRDCQVIPGVLQDDDEAEEAGNSFVGDEGALSYGSEGMNIVDPSPITDDEHEEARNIQDKAAPETTEPMSPSTPADTASITPSALSKSPSLPPVPSLPPEPPAFDPSPFPDKDTRKLAEKEHSRQVKAYKQAVKDRDKAIKDRRKLLEKREKNAKMAREKQVKRDARELTRLEEDGKKNQPKSPAKLKKDPTGIPNKNGQDEPLPEKPKRDKKFCMLPPRINGERDPCWVRVFMRDVDEVGAHCGLFLVGEQYEGLVGDVGERVSGWVEG